MFKWFWLLLKAMTRQNSLSLLQGKKNDKWHADFSNWSLSYGNQEIGCANGILK